MGVFDASKLDKMKKAYRAGEFKKAYTYAEKLDQLSIKTVYDLSMLAEVYVKNHKYNAAKEIYIRIFEKNNSINVCKEIIKLCIKTKNVREAIKYIKELNKIDPEDYERFIFQYKVGKLLDQPDEYLIECLKKVREADYIDKWALELARLYYANGMLDECRTECHNINLWFPESDYALKAEALVRNIDAGISYADSKKKDSAGEGLVYSEPVSDAEVPEESAEPVYDSYSENEYPEADMPEQEEGFYDENGDFEINFDEAGLWENYDDDGEMTEIVTDEEVSEEMAFDGDDAEISYEDEEIETEVFPEENDYADYPETIGEDADDAETETETEGFEEDSFEDSEEWDEEDFLEDSEDWGDDDFLAGAEGDEEAFFVAEGDSYAGVEESVSESDEGEFEEAFFEDSEEWDEEDFLEDSEDWGDDDFLADEEVFFDEEFAEDQDIKYDEASDEQAAASEEIIDEKEESAEENKADDLIAENDSSVRTVVDDWVDEEADDVNVYGESNWAESLYEDSDDFAAAFDAERSDCNKNRSESLSDSVSKIMESDNDKASEKEDFATTLVNDSLTHDVIRALREQEENGIINGVDEVDESILKMIEE